MSKLENRTRFEWGVLGLAAAVLVLMTGWFFFRGMHPVDTWQVEVERDERAVSDSIGEVEWPEGLLEGEVMDLNTATQSDLERLPGIGAALAQAIAEYRQTNGSFASVDDLVQVEGIGSATLEHLRPYVMVGK